IRNDKAKEALFGTYFRGMGMNEIRRAGERFADSIDRMLRPNTMTKLNWHLSMGHDVYIVTASMPQWIRPWATAAGISDVIGTEPETDSSGILTGRFATPNCYGPEKVRRFMQVEPDRSSYRLIAYGDSEGDREMLYEADESHLV
ncbi:MAG: HAD-IB family hydrolase, partial [Muribaculaceae bacterium]|nr:HAD-IB family hydrolase [Muribaculaceae bacterium]